MKRLLFIDACIRGEERSRTARLASAFLTHVDKDYQIEHLRLTDCGCTPLTRADLERRDALLAAGRTDDPLFSAAHTLARADRIVVAAPYWDLSFPALLRAYFERVSVCGVTFHYTAAGQEGLCKAEKAVYISTLGGCADTPHLGESYVKALFQMFGIQEFQSFRAAGLDIVGADVEAILRGAEEKARQLAAAF